MYQRLKVRWDRLRGRTGVALAMDVGLIIIVFALIHAWNTRELPDGQDFPGLILSQLDIEQAPQTLPRDGVGVVYFFAPWCFYCRNSIDNLDKLVNNGDVSWARAVALDYENLEDVRAFVQETGLSQPVLIGNRQTAQDWNIRAFPTYFVVDSEGKISSRSVGYSTHLGMLARAWLAGL